MIYKFLEKKKKLSFFALKSAFFALKSAFFVLKSAFFVLKVMLTYCI